MTDLIRDMPMDDRPRERLLEHGPAELSNSDLLAILLGSGTRGTNAIQLARQLLREGVETLARQDVADLAKIHGIGPAKATRLAAAFELSKRRQRLRKRPFDSQEFGKKLVHTVAHYRQERLGAALLDGRHQIVRQRQIFIGTVNYTLVSPREILQFALQHDAVAVVIYHNHPSGNTTPSREDIDFTKKLKSALQLVEIELLDHFIVAGKTFRSMKERDSIWG
jgi:DNA repair protein RadC